MQYVYLYIYTSVSTYWSVYLFTLITLNSCIKVKIVLNLYILRSTVSLVLWLPSVTMHPIATGATSPPSPTGGDSRAWLWGCIAAPLMRDKHPSPFISSWQWAVLLLVNGVTDDHICNQGSRSGAGGNGGVLKKEQIPSLQKREYKVLQLISFKNVWGNPAC